MHKTFVFLFAAIAAFSADDPWTKVRELNSGAELRIYRHGESKALEAKMDEADQTRLLVVVKNAQVAIAKNLIDRIDARPPATGSRVTKQTRIVNDPGPNPNPAIASKERPGPTTTESTNFTLKGKPDFETIYRRQPEARK